MLLLNHNLYTSSNEIIQPQQVRVVQVSNGEAAPAYTPMETSGPQGYTNY